MLTYDQLVEELHYDQITGIFTRKKSCKGRKENAIVGSKRKDGYLTTSFRRKFFYIHRLAWFYIYKEWPNGLIDHINGIKSDNRIDNLRDVDFLTNATNHSKKPNSITGYVGIYKDETTKRLKNKYTTQFNNKTFRFEKLEDCVEFRKQNNLKL